MRQIYAAVHGVPEGRLCSYGKIAELAGQPGRARYVGRILSQLPSNTQLPWFRIVNSQGKISFPAQSENYQRQLSHLINESSADESGKLFWRQCRWPD
ncbi:DNA base-flipping protein [Zhongshania aliphaticivorans]|uniref:DNA base-flipping protein n=1 Tax=Zhongshania aliphaticivorans TaxID=1470434 RepID=A0A5S9PYW8_9GAMM|nr:MGMT family protein [Zhongshania aliphaticivorans]CAA0109673.1 DNA base-flipping protein [Zhongshania aliphaticivorans]CAA0117833.1 DNA base-flipping protein [Zhongshania aliphaticivorans]CAA0121564.1 DNA base-flipping protein [Zhongshania aliphaticivorans]